MELRLTIKTTPGRPALAIAIMAALLATTMALAWAVSSYKTGRAIAFGRPIQMRGVPLQISPPAGWVAVQVRDRAGALVTFIDPASSPARPRTLRVYRVSATPTDAASLLADFLQAARPRSLESLDHVRIGPLIARQGVVTTHGGGEVQQHILRAAVLGQDRYLLLILDCLGPPTPWEYRLIDGLAGAARPAPDQYPAPNRLAGRTGVALEEDNDAWVASLFAEEEGVLRLLPRATEPAGPSFWGEVELNVLRLAPDTDLAEWLKATLASHPSLRDILGGAPGAGRLPPVEQRGIGPVTAWRLRSPERSVVHLAYVFRPLPGASVEGPAGPADPTLANRAILLKAWAAADDESRAVPAVERLIRSIRLR